MSRREWFVATAVAFALYLAWRSSADDQATEQQCAGRDARINARRNQLPTARERNSCLHHSTPPAD